MSAVPFDTLKLAERLGAGGFTAVQSRTFASALAGAAATVDVATKADLLKWIVSAIGLQTVVTIDAVMTLMRLAH